MKIIIYEITITLITVLRLLISQKVNYYYILIKKSYLHFS